MAPRHLRQHLLLSQQLLEPRPQSHHLSHPTDQHTQPLPQQHSSPLDSHQHHLQQQQQEQAQEKENEHEREQEEEEEELEEEQEDEGDDEEDEAAEEEQQQSPCQQQQEPPHPPEELYQQTTAIDTPAPPSANGSGSISSLPSDQVEAVLTAAESRASKLLQQSMDTVQSQILQALHRAALDIIQHLGKEAARRVVIAERKAAVLEQELLNVKQQALSMLLRLKGDSDAQILEAEKKYLLEKRRAQDAEGKLAAVQDMSKRLKSELRKKGEILEKMQKLVQPVDGEYSDKSCRLAESLDRRKIGGKSKFDGLHANIPQLKAENAMQVSSEIADDSRYSKNGPRVVLSNGTPRLSMPKTQEQTPEMELERRMETSTTETSSVDEAGLLGVRWQVSSVTQNVEGTLESPETSRVEETEAGKRPLIHDGRGTNIDCYSLVEQSGQVETPSLVSNERNNKKVAEVHIAGFHEGNKSEEEMYKQTAAGLQRSSDFDGVKTDEDSGNTGKILLVKERTSRGFTGSDDKFSLGERGLVNEFLPRANAKENGDMETACCTNGAISNISLNQVSLKGNGDLERKYQILDSRKCNLDHIIDPDLTSSRANTPDLTAMMEPGSVSINRGKEEILAEEVCCDTHARNTESAPCVPEGWGLVASSEFVRPDYEVATELAGLGTGVVKVSAEASASSARREEIDNTTRKAGLRMKRKGAFLEQKSGPGLEVNQAKKPRTAKRQAGLTDRHTERILRKSRLNNPASSTENLVVESSRDSRRLMQGARQLLCLSEKKWR